MDIRKRTLNCASCFDRGRGDRSVERDQTVNCQKHYTLRQVVLSVIRGRKMSDSVSVAFWLR